MSYEILVDEEPTVHTFLRTYIKPGSIYKIHDVQYQIDSLINSGSEASVYKSIKVNQKDIFYVTLRISEATDVAKLQRQVTNLKIVKEFSMPFIQKLIDFDIIKIEQKQVLFEVYEYADYNSDSVELKNQHFGNQDSKFVKRAVLQLCAATCFIHGWLYVHRDIKPDNILFKKIGNSDQLDLKLCDFGFLRMENPLMTQVGTPQFSAPEIWCWIKDKENNSNTQQGSTAAGLAKYGVRVDVWSIGITCFYMLTGRNPLGTYTGQSQWKELIKNLQFKQETLDATCEIIQDQQLKDLCKSFLQYDEKKRPNIAQFVLKNFEKEVDEYGLTQWFKKQM